MGKLARKRREASGRKSERYAEIGRKFEGEVADLLQKMQDEKLIAGFAAPPPYSPDDRQGRDFTVTASVDGKEASRSFGVSISLRRWNHSKMLHPDVPQFCFPIGTKPETIRKRILQLFQES